jgi:drug/metabolite transporter (DMT)-like permease
MTQSKENQGYLMVAAAAMLWGSMGIIAQLLYNRGLNAGHIVFWKLAFGFIIILAYLMVKDRKLLRISRRGLMLTMLMGLYCQACYNFFIFSSVERVGVATFTILLYTSPLFIILMSRFFFGEKLTPVKLAALFLSTAGTVLTVTEGKLHLLEMNGFGVAMGLMAGFTFAVSTIATKKLTLHYNRWTLSLYFFGFGALFAIPISNPLGVLSVNPGLTVWLGLFLLGLLPTAMGYGLYIKAFSYGIEASRAGILTTIEIIVAVGAATFLLSDPMGGLKLAGIIMVFTAVLMIQLDRTAVLWIWNRRKFQKVDGGRSK